MKSSKLSKVVAIGGAACVFAGGMASFPLSFLGDLALSIPLAGATGLGLWYFWPSRRPVTAQDIKDLYANVEALNEASKHGISTKEVVEAIKMGTDKLDRILEEAKQIRSPNTIRRIKHIDAIGRKIVEDFRIDPKDVRIANSWLNSYLDETITLVKGYAQLSRNGARSIEAQTQMAKFDDMLDLLEKNFQSLLDRLLANDTVDFDVNLTVMENRLKMEGM